MNWSDVEAHHVLIEVHDLRLKPQYQAGIALLLTGAKSYEAVTKKAKKMAEKKGSKEYAAVRVMIGTWENIATHVQDFNTEQKQWLFRCNPIQLMWNMLEDAVKTIRHDGADQFLDQSTNNFAERFEKLAKEYADWRSSSKEYTTQGSLAIRAMFG